MGVSRFRSWMLVVVLGAVAFEAVAQFSGLPLRTPRPSANGDPRGQSSAPDYRQYEYGREVYAVKLGCPGCPFGDHPLDEALARRLLADDSLRTDLSLAEGDAVMVFLRQRFALP